MIHIFGRSRCRSHGMFLNHYSTLLISLVSSMGGYFWFWNIVGGIELITNNSRLSIIVVVTCTRFHGCIGLILISTAWTLFGLKKEWGILLGDLNNIDLDVLLLLLLLLLLNSLQWREILMSSVSIVLLVFIIRFIIVITLNLWCDMTFTVTSVTIFRWNITQNVIHVPLLRWSGIIRWLTGFAMVATEPYLVTIRAASRNTSLVLCQVFSIFNALIASKGKQTLAKRRLFWQSLGQLYRLG